MLPCLVIFGFFHGFTCWRGPLLAIFVFSSDFFWPILNFHGQLLIKFIFPKGCVLVKFQTYL
jgi:hypothetical protein